MYTPGDDVDIILARKYFILLMLITQAVRGWRIGSLHGRDAGELLHDAWRIRV